MSDSFVNNDNLHQYLIQELQALSEEMSNQIEKEPMPPKYSNLVEGEEEEKYDTATIDNKFLLQMLKSEGLINEEDNETKDDEVEEEDNDENIKPETYSDEKCKHLEISYDHDPPLYEETLSLPHIYESRHEWDLLSVKKRGARLAEFYENFHKLVKTTHGDTGIKVDNDGDFLRFGDMFSVYGSYDVYKKDKSEAEVKDLDPCFMSELPFMAGNYKYIFVNVGFDNKPMLMIYNEKIGSPLYLLRELLFKRRHFWSDGNQYIFTNSMRLFYKMPCNMLRRRYWAMTDDVASEDHHYFYNEAISEYHPHSFNNFFIAKKENAAKFMSALRGNFVNTITKNRKVRNQTTTSYRELYVTDFENHLGFGLDLRKFKRGYQTMAKAVFDRNSRNAFAMLVYNDNAGFVFDNRLSSKSTEQLLTIKYGNSKISGSEPELFDFSMLTSKCLEADNINKTIRHYYRL
ncbi:hypothetical protein PvNV_084 [Penaeus vannamei nudivirus]|nr:hypothetical protein PvSNPV_084 [Penaeus vannamei nucleopolyhedrovirus]